MTLMNLSRFLKSHHSVKRNCTLKEISRCLSTVYALSSGQGKCGVAVVRVTGDRAREVLTTMTVPPRLPHPRIAALRRIVHPSTGKSLDRGLVLWFPGPHSFTGEDSCEIHIHGGSAVVTAVLNAMSTISGFHPAQPGDFTKRAFYNAKLDLTAVEGLGDLIHAETEAQRKQALQQMEGALGQLYLGWRQKLLHCRANIEAFIDFSEDDNIEEGVITDVETTVKELIVAIKNHLSDDRRGERLRSGLQLAILGRPNVGKSSFLNALVQRPAAIVSPIPGTTRDIVETTLDIGGYPVVLSDTAGLRKTEDIIESEGIKRALARAERADIAVIIVEANDILQLIKEKGKTIDWNEYLKSYFVNIGVYEDSNYSQNNNTYDWIENRNYLTLINKIDLIESESDRALLENTINDSLISIKTREGFDGALHKLKDLCASLCDIGTAENPTLTAARHRIHITACLESLQFIIGSNNTNKQENYNSSSDKMEYQSSSSISENKCCPSNDMYLDSHDNLLHSEENLIVAAHHLQKATNHLGYVTGHVTTEEVLDHIFSAFCIGK